MLKKISKKLEKTFSRSPLFFKIYAKPYQNVVEREIQLTKKHGELKQPLLNIGCGSMPFTAYYLAKKTGLQVHAVDQNPEMTKLARETLQKLDIENKIKTIEKKASEIDYKNYQNVYTALHLSPKKKIYNRFIQTANPKAQFLVREPRKRFKNQYDQIHNSEKPKECVKHNLITFNRSCLYTKK
ncbi:SAM-dependent methyltransferase [Methanonatronarchaeum thermophilum]|uniref:SAM-dependent methyltransferase n=1 Tax=Methanonatronarchaeum thermophilum TaxID=1927129 RepID=A0A1Y3GAL7_9EURY|nr:methyltransferase domain-containing protein [Methanonatronarchaeum thermophilum]OUJ18459.1 SAM-dependent methyltransferase [Methanonatronarchaeum thermophilum]